MGELDDYWNYRKAYGYYGTAVELARDHAPSATSVIDVGSRDTLFLDLIDWVPRKTAIDRYFRPVVPGAENIQSDFMSHSFSGRFDLAFCLQVLEHLEDPGPFARRLLQIARLVVISVPYRWPNGHCKWHKQDPVDELKLLAWTERPWREMKLVRDNAERLVAVFDGVT